MQLTLQITTGPHAGRKVLLRSGQVARIGRTEWADFSFPRDADLADVHFAVQCQLHGARLRKLAPDRTLSVNSQEVTEAELQVGRYDPGRPIGVCGRLRRTDQIAAADADSGSRGSDRRDHYVHRRRIGIF